jgi:tetratricopeptide (TPR) repeat protein
VLLRKHDDARAIASVLLKVDPVPLEAVDAVLNGIVPGTPGLAVRVHKSYPAHCRPQLTASVLAAEVEGNLDLARECVQKASSLASTPEDREEVARLLISLSANYDEVEDAYAREYLRTSFPDGHPLETVVEAERLRASGQPIEARALLESERQSDRIEWIQSYSNTLLALGDVDAAIATLEGYSERMRHPGFLRECAKLAYKHGRKESAAEFLEKAVRKQPQNLWL